MKKMTLIFMGILLITLTGCGGGGGGASSNNTPITMVLKVSTTGTIPAGSSLIGVGFTVTLPAGVSIATDQSGNPAAGVVVPSGVLSSTTSTGTAIYTPAGAAPAKLDIIVTSSVAGGFGIGEFVSINAVRPSGSAAPTAADFSLSNFAPSDQLSQPIPGIGGSLTVQ